MGTSTSQTRTTFGFARWTKTESSPPSPAQARRDILVTEALPPPQNSGILVVSPSTLEGTSTWLTTPEYERSIPPGRSPPSLAPGELASRGTAVLPPRLL